MTFVEDFSEQASVLASRFVAFLNFESVQPGGTSLGGSPLPEDVVTSMELTKLLISLTDVCTSGFAVSSNSKHFGAAQ